MTMFDDDSLLNLPATAALDETREDYTGFYENVELPSGVFNGRHGILRGATPADIVEEISESELEEIYEGLVET